MKDKVDDKAGDVQKVIHEDEIATGADDEFPAAPRARPLAHWQGKLLSQEECSKVGKIVAACEDTRDVRLLATYATSPHGLVDDQVRRIACMPPHNLLLQFEVVLMYLPKGRYCWDIVNRSRLSRHNPGVSYHDTGMKIKSSWMLIEHSSTTRTVSSPNVFCMIGQFVNVEQTNPTSSSTAEKRSSRM